MKSLFHLNEPKENLSYDLTTGGIMELIRQNRLYFVIAQLSIFSVIFASSVSEGIIDSQLIYALVDIEDIEKEENEQSEKRQKEYYISDFYLKSSKSLFMRQNMKFSKFNFNHSWEVFLEVFTPPPEV